MTLVNKFSSTSEKNWNTLTLQKVIMFNIHYVARNRIFEPHFFWFDQRNIIWFQSQPEVLKTFHWIILVRMIHILQCSRAQEVLMQIEKKTLLSSNHKFHLTNRKLCRASFILFIFNEMLRWLNAWSTLHAYSLLYIQYW